MQVMREHVLLYAVTVARFAPVQYSDKNIRCIFREYRGFNGRAPFDVIWIQECSGYTTILYIIYNPTSSGAQLLTHSVVLSHSAHPITSAQCMDQRLRDAVESD